MDISSDGELIVTGSADKNIKIWGLDFGDCHKSIFAHADRYYMIFHLIFMCFWLIRLHFKVSDEIYMVVLWQCNLFLRHITCLVLGKTA